MLQCLRMVGSRLSVLQHSPHFNSIPPALVCGASLGTAAQYCQGMAGAFCSVHQGCNLLTCNSFCLGGHFDPSTINPQPLAYMGLGVAAGSCYRGPWTGLLSVAHCGRINLSCGHCHSSHHYIGEGATLATLPQVWPTNHMACAACLIERMVVPMVGMEAQHHWTCMAFLS